MAAFADGVTEINSLDSYFTHKAVTAPGTAYKNIYALKSGETINKSGIEKAVKEVYEDIRQRLCCCRCPTSHPLTVSSS